jgi:hypothetical protein
MAKGEKVNIAVTLKALTVTMKRELGLEPPLGWQRSDLDGNDS